MLRFSGHYKLLCRWSTCFTGHHLKIQPQISVFFPVCLVLADSPLLFLPRSTGSCPGQFELIFTCLTLKQQSDHPALLSSFIFKPGPLDKSADLTQCFVIRTIRFHCVGKKMLRPSHFSRPVLWDSTGAEAVNYSVRVMAVGGIRLIPDKSAVSVGSRVSALVLLRQRGIYGGWFSSGKIFANTQQSCFPDSPHASVCLFSSSFQLNFYT